MIELILRLAFGNPFDVIFQFPTLFCAFSGWDRVPLRRRERAGSGRFRFDGLRFYALNFGGLYDAVRRRKTPKERRAHPLHVFDS